MCVPSPAGRRQYYYLSLHALVRELRQRVEEREGIVDFRLVFAGRDLEDPRSLVESGVRHEATVTLVLRQRGGAGTPPPEDDCECVAGLGVDPNCPRGAACPRRRLSNGGRHDAVEHAPAGPRWVNPWKPQPKRLNKDVQGPRDMPLPKRQVWGPEATDSFVPLAGVVGRADTTPSQLTKEGQAEPGRRGTGAGSSPQAVRAQANDALVLPPEAQQDVGMQEAQARAQAAQAARAEREAEARAQAEEAALAEARQQAMVAAREHASVRTVAGTRAQATAVEQAQGPADSLQGGPVLPPARQPPYTTRKSRPAVELLCTCNVVPPEPCVVHPVRVVRCNGCGDEVEVTAFAAGGWQCECGSTRTSSFDVRGVRNERGRSPVRTRSPGRERVGGGEVRERSRSPMEPRRLSWAPIDRAVTTPSIYTIYIKSTQCARCRLQDPKEACGGPHTFALEVTKQTRVVELRRLIDGACGCAPAEQVLQYKGEVMRDGDTLGSAGVEPWEDLQLVWGEVSAQREEAGIGDGGRVAMDADGDATVSSARRGSGSMAVDGSLGVSESSGILEDRDAAVSGSSRILEGRNVAVPEVIHALYVADGQPRPEYGMAELEVTDATTVAELKCQLGKATQVAPDDQRLWFAGRELSDTATVAECGVNAGTCNASTAHLCGAHPAVMDPGVAKPGLLMLRRRAGSLPFSVHVSYRSLTQLAGRRSGGGTREDMMSAMSGRCGKGFYSASQRRRPRRR